MRGAAHSEAGLKRDSSASPSIKAGSSKSERQVPSHVYLGTTIHLHTEKKHQDHHTKDKTHRGEKDQEESLGGKRITEQPKNKVSPDHLLRFPLHRTLTWELKSLN